MFGFLVIAEGGSEVARTTPYLHGGQLPNLYRRTECWQCGICRTIDHSMSKRIGVVPLGGPMIR
ncbi:hypothetical protein N7520_004207 [Penicillium odoratum]|uniref:uncharacterized protein n=1 Tax=Penicillium odoratum TaxID=1167516 RepID=UPI0025484BA3|nr:uncharacterized protein N7520_004207 [Penicillium odoratum]KAJ5769648.1 hypothetical protein N7520_004207 [Penicillium odoratum]